MASRLGQRNTVEQSLFSRRGRRCNQWLNRRKGPKVGRGVFCVPAAVRSNTQHHHVTTPLRKASIHLSTLPGLTLRSRKPWRLLPLHICIRRPGQMGQQVPGRPGGLRLVSTDALMSRNRMRDTLRRAAGHGAAELLGLHVAGIATRAVVTDRQKHEPIDWPGRRCYHTLRWLELGH